MVPRTVFSNSYEKVVGKFPVNGQANCFGQDKEKIKHRNRRTRVPRGIRCNLSEILLQRSYSPVARNMYTNDGTLWASANYGPGGKDGKTVIPLYDRKVSESALE